MTTPYCFVLRDLAIKPYVRMTQRSKFADPQARQYLASKAMLSSALAAVMVDKGWTMLPERTPLRCVLTFFQPKRLHGADLDNLAKAALDAAQGVVFRDDRWVDVIEADRWPGDALLVFTVGVL